MESMIQHSEHTGSGYQVVLYYGVSTAADQYGHSWLERLAAEHEWFCYRPTLSREEHAGRRGWLPVLLAEDYPRAAGPVAYSCGRSGADSPIPGCCRRRPPARKTRFIQIPVSRNSVLLIFPFRVFLEAWK
jgi:hypothetical protein